MHVVLGAIWDETESISKARACASERRRGIVRSDVTLASALYEAISCEQSRDFAPRCPLESSPTPVSSLLLLLERGRSPDFVAYYLLFDWKASSLQPLRMI